MTTVVPGVGLEGIEGYKVQVEVQLLPEVKKGLVLLDYHNLGCLSAETIVQYLTAALTDRLTHKSHVINMNGVSYRMKETEKWMKMNER